MYKVYNRFPPSFMAHFFVSNDQNSETRLQSKFDNPVNPKTTNYGLKTRIYHALLSRLHSKFKICKRK